jgi:hypothetical protein
MWLGFDDFLSYTLGVGLVLFTFAMIINFIKDFAKN